MAAPNKPIYTEQELFNHMKEYFADVKITLNDIKNPSQPFVMEFYKRILVEFDIDVDSVLQAQMCQTANLLHPEAYVDIIPIRNLVSALNSFGIFKPYQGFRLTDLVNPKPRRNLILMSAMMHFLIFSDCRLGSIQHKLNQVEEKKQERDSLLKTKDELKEMLQKKAIDRAQKEIQMEVLKKEYARLLEEQRSIMKRKEECVALADNAKARLAEEQRNLRKAKQRETEVLDELNELKSRVVESPKQVVTEFRMLQKKSEEMKEKKEAMRNLIESKQQISEKLSNELKAQKERNAELKEIIDLIHKTRDAECELETINKKHADIKKKEKKVTQERKELEETVTTRSNELKVLQNETQSLEDKVKAAVKENSDLKEAASNVAGISITGSNDILKKINELNETLENNKTEFKKLVESSEAEYKEIMKNEKESNAAIMKELLQMAEGMKFD